MKNFLNNISGILKTAAFITLIGALICFQICMLMLGSNTFERLLPVVLTAVFAIAYAVLHITGLFEKKRWLCIAALAGAAALAVILLRAFC